MISNTIYHIAFFPQGQHDGRCSSSHLALTHVERNRKGESSAKFCQELQSSFISSSLARTRSHKHLYLECSEENEDWVIHPKESASESLVIRKYSFPYFLCHFELRFLLLSAEKKKFLMGKIYEIFAPAYKILSESAPHPAFPISSHFSHHFPATLASFSS